MSTSDTATRCEHLSARCGQEPDARHERGSSLELLQEVSTMRQVIDFAILRVRNQDFVLCSTVVDDMGRFKMRLPL